VELRPVALLFLCLLSLSLSPSLLSLLSVSLFELGVIFTVLPNIITCFVSALNRSFDDYIIADASDVGFKSELGLAVLGAFSSLCFLGGLSARVL
jgi:hypothetical protein